MNIKDYVPILVICPNDWDIYTTAVSVRVYTMFRDTHNTLRYYYFDPREIVT